MKKYFALLLALAMVLSMLSGCAKDETPADPGDPSTPDGNQAQAGTSNPLYAPVVEAASYKKDVVVAASAGFTMLDPHGTYNVAHNENNILVYETLVFWNSQTMEFEPKLATEWKWVNDTTLRVKLHEGITSHAGDPFTASDVIFTVTTGQEGGLLSNYYGMFDLAECKAEDDYTVVLASKTPDPFFLYTLSNTPLAMIVEKSTEKDGLDAQTLNPTAATGPYKFVEWSDGSYVKLERNENYWGKTPYYKNVEIRIITDKRHDVEIAYVLGHIAREAREIGARLDEGGSPFEAARDVAAPDERHNLG